MCHETPLEWVTPPFFAGNLLCEAGERTARTSSIPIARGDCDYPVGLRSQGMGVADSRAASGELKAPSTARRQIWAELKTKYLRAPIMVAGAIVIN